MADKAQKLEAVGRLAQALVRRMEAGRLSWLRLDSATTYYVSRVRAVTLFLAWHHNASGPSLILHTADRVVAGRDQSLLALWDKVRSSQIEAEADLATQIALLEGTAQLADDPHGA